MSIGITQTEDIGTVLPAFDRLPSAVPVAVLAADPLLRSGLVTALHGQPGSRLVEGDPREAEVVVAVIDTTRTLPYLVVESARHARLVLVADPPLPGELRAVIEGRRLVLLPRKEATPERLRRAISDAHQGHGHLPPEQVDVVAPPGPAAAGLSHRELTVLRLLAEGYDTADIAADMAYSERTVKNILHKLTRRLGLRNRTHAVSFALRHGLL